MTRAALIPVMALAVALQTGGPGERLSAHRNLGKAFYENPATQPQAVDEFRRALELAPQSAREILNYGLALLRAGKTKEGALEIERAQRLDPKIPHTWFNLGIVYKREGETEKATRQFERMVELVPDEPVSHYNLGVLYKLAGKTGEAVNRFETATRLDPSLAGPHFQLFNAYRQAKRQGEAQRELAIFQEIKKRTEGAAVPEDMEWSYYAEIYDPVEARAAAEPPAELKFRELPAIGKVDPKSAGIVALDADGDGRPEPLAWSESGVAGNASLAAIKGARAIAAGDFNNDGLADLCVVTAAGASLWVNRKGRFRAHPAKLPDGSYEHAVWLDYDQDYDLDLFLLGDRSRLMRNNGAAGFGDQTPAFPFVAGHALEGALFELIADSRSMDLLVAYEDRGGVLYRDRLGGKYEA
ncbi:MAG: FG-GAP-like repeat-containing protein, partial [Bryobacteraceae bacterium]